MKERLERMLAIAGTIVVGIVLGFVAVGFGESWLFTHVGCYSGAPGWLVLFLSSLSGACIVGWLIVEAGFMEDL